ncbi:MAG TPA: serine/threonine-protein kinase, partial [Streptosporangiaceae bacterium]|nr:serine/threonine-protein kinase [Streptosporangiaceae bacterium]
MGLAGNLLAGRYRLDEPIGSGGFSEVWRATDTVLARPIAVKLLHPGCAQQPEVLARFRAEAQRAATLWHVNIAHIYDYDEPADGVQPYLVMELVDGPSLAGVLAGGPLSAAWAMDIVAQTAAGLQAAHATGLIHRDIKPGNLLLASSGTVKITDFGISHAIGSVPVTVTGVLMGTAGYLAPERIAGAQAGPASDLYALGVVAYECLAGAPPFAGEPLDVACAHRERPVPPLLPSVPANVSALVMQLVAKDPAWRPGSAAEVAHRAGRLRDDLRDGYGVGAGRVRYPLAAAAAVPPPASAIAPAVFAADARRGVPAVSLPASRARTGARRRRRRPALVLASVAIAGLIGTAVTVTIGAASVQHPPGALPSAPPGHSVGGIAAAPPARQPSAARPIRKAAPGTDRGDMVAVHVIVPDRRTVAGAGSGHGRRHEEIRRHRDGSDAGHGRGSGHGHDDGNGHGQGNGHGHDHGNGQGQGNGNGNGQGNG